VQLQRDSRERRERLARARSVSAQRERARLDARMDFELRAAGYTRRLYVRAYACAHARTLVYVNKRKMHRELSPAGIR